MFFLRRIIGKSSDPAHAFSLQVYATHEATKLSDKQDKARNARQAVHAACMCEERFTRFGQHTNKRRKPMMEGRKFYPNAPAPAEKWVPLAACPKTGGL